MSITFKEIMGYVPGHNETVFHEIEDSLGQLLPFVGAGLTADFYGTWNAALKALSAGITDEAAKDELDALLDSRKNLEAAQLIEDRHGKNNLQRDMIRHFSRQKLLDNREAMKRQAIDLLPLLFPCPVLTTNFDEAIELVYNDQLYSSEEEAAAAREATGRPDLFDITWYSSLDLDEVYGATVNISDDLLVSRT